MSKQVDTAAGNKLVREAMERVIAGCKAKDCAFCVELQRVLDEAAKTDDLHLVD